jgi:hypothetical protein
VFLLVNSIGNPFQKPINTAKYFKETTVLKYDVERYEW